VFDIPLDGEEGADLYDDVGDFPPGTGFVEGLNAGASEQPVPPRSARLTAHEGPKKMIRTNHLLVFVVVFIKSW